jgi:hypothetical protein
MGISRKQALSQVLKNAAAEFEHRDWRIEKPLKVRLKATKSPSKDAEHTLLISEPMGPPHIPDNFVGLACFVNVYFVELEAIINRAMGNEDASIGKVSLSLDLARVVREDHLYLGSVHLLSIEGDDAVRSLDCFLADYDHYLEPARQQLVDLRALENDEYVPPGVSVWSWFSRRAAYYYRYADATTKRTYFDEFASEATRFLADLGEPNDKESRISTDIHAIMMSSARREAQELLKLIDAL